MKLLSRHNQRPEILTRFCDTIHVKKRRPNRCSKPSLNLKQKNPRHQFEMKPSQPSKSWRCAKIFLYLKTEALNSTVPTQKRKKTRRSEMHRQAPTVCFTDDQCRSPHKLLLLDAVLNLTTCFRSELESNLCQ